MKGKTYSIAAMMLAILVLFTSVSYNVSAQSTEAEHVFTYEELACMDYEPIEDNASRTGDQLVPINKTENSTKGSPIYYIIECADGYMLTSPTTNTFSRTRYSTGNSDSHVHQKWLFGNDEYGNLRISVCHTPVAMLLTVNPETKAVTLGMYKPDPTYQSWKMYYSSNGNALECVSSDSRVNGYRLVINGSSLSVSNTTYTPVGFFDVDWYTPVTSLSYTGFYLAPKQAKYVYPTKTPSNATCSNSWMNWSSSSSACMKVDKGGKVTGVSAGTATLTFRDKITRVYGTCTINVTQIANGTYFLKNKENSQYAKVESGTMSNGQNVVQYDFDVNASERWIFTLNTSTGYYSIKSANSGSTAYYMAVSDDSSALNKPIVIRSATESTLTDGMKWKVAKTSNGAYKITPKTGEANDYVLCTKTIFGFNNWNLVQSDYVQNSSYCDEWFIYCTTNDNISLDVVYDQAYANRYSGYYSRINDEIKILQEKYLNEFEIWIEQNGCNSFNSYADTYCSTAYNSTCNHADNGGCSNSMLYQSGSTTLRTYHHNNIFNIMLRIPFPTANHSAKIAFIGHNNCCIINGEHKTNPYYGLTFPSIRLMTIMTFSSKSSEILTVVHEFGHLYSAPDHYGGSAESTIAIRDRTGDNRFDSNCIYGENRYTSDVTSNLTICDGCKAIISSNAGDYNN